MDKINDGGPAFPIPDPFNLKPETEDDMLKFAAGMSMRDAFAIAAAQTLEPPRFLVGRAETDANLKSWASQVWRMADAMLHGRG